MTKMSSEPGCSPKQVAHPTAPSRGSRMTHGVCHQHQPMPTLAAASVAAATA